MTLPDVEPTRKERFFAALKLARMTVEQWCTDHGKVGRQHLYRVLEGERVGGSELEAAIDATIEKYLGAAQA